MICVELLLGGDEMSTVYYSVLSYYPSFITNENVNLGVLFYVVENNYASFYSIKRWERVRAFDDEVDIDFMKDYLKGLSQDVESNLFNYQNKFNIEEFVRYYVNEYKFSNIQTVETDEVDIFIDETKKMYLKYDFEKGERLGKDKEKQYINRLLRTQNIPYNKDKIRGYFNEKIQYDYIIGEYGIKLFTFEGKNLARLINTAKTWSYTAREMKDRYKTVFIYAKENRNEYYDSIIQILKENAQDIMPLDEGIDYLLSLKQ